MRRCLALATLAVVAQINCRNTATQDTVDNGQHEHNNTIQTFSASFDLSSSKSSGLSISASIDIPQFKGKNHSSSKNHTSSVSGHFSIGGNESTHGNFSTNEDNTYEVSQDNSSSEDSGNQTD